MAILVTGGAGYIGSHVVWALQDKDIPVVVVDNLVTGHRCLLPESVPFITADVDDMAQMAHVFHSHAVTAVIHLAASLLVEESVTQPAAYYQNNIGAMAGLLAAGTAAGVKQWVFSSSAAVYGPTGQHPVAENASLAPANPYGRTKLAGEWLLADAMTACHGSAVTLRYFNVAGADPQGRSGECPPVATHLVKRACMVATGQKECLQVFGTDYDTPDGTCVRDYVHVSDVADAHVKALAYLAGGGHSTTLNVGYGQGISVQQMLTAFEHQLGRPLPVTHAPRRAGDVAIAVANASNIKATLGWAPNHDDVAPIVQTALAWENTWMTKAPVAP